MRGISLAPRAADECMRRSCSPTSAVRLFLFPIVCLSVRPSVYMSVCPSVYLFVRRSVRLFVSYDGNNNRNYYSYNIVLYYYKKTSFQMKMLNTRWILSNRRPLQLEVEAPVHCSWQGMDDRQVTSRATARSVKIYSLYTFIITAF